MLRCFLASILLMICVHAHSHDTISVRGHRYVFKKEIKIGEELTIYRLADTGMVRILNFTLSVDARDEFGGSCTQSKYLVTHDSLIVYTRHINWGEQRDDGWEIESNYLSKSIYVFQSTGKLILLSRVFGSDSKKLYLELDRMLPGCHGG